MLNKPDITPTPETVYDDVSEELAHAKLLSDFAQAASCPKETTGILNAIRKNWEAENNAK